MSENIEILQRQFDAYCTKVLKYAAITYYHANRRRKAHEVSFSSLLEKDLAEVSTTDRYPCMLYHFQVREWLIEVQSESLGNAIEQLIPYRREIILLLLSIILDNISYHDFLIIPTISRKADNYGLLLKKGRDNFFINGRYPTVWIQMP